ncbi:hypothetical protein ALC62_08481, partial [Cyphomyrmex costatus]
RASAVLCLREFSTARRRRHVTERGGNPFYIVVDAEEYTTNRGKDFIEQAGADDFFTRLTGDTHSRLSRAACNPLLSANQHVGMHSHAFAEERTVYAYSRQKTRHDEKDRSKITETTEKKWRTNPPSIGKDGCPIIETSVNRKRKKNPGFARVSTHSSGGIELHFVFVSSWCNAMNENNRRNGRGTTRARTCYVRYIRRESNEYTEADGRPRGPDLRSRAKSVGGAAQSTLSQYDTRTSRANVDERHGD